VRHESGKEHAFSCPYLEGFLPRIHIKLSFKNIEEFVLIGMYVRRRLVSGRHGYLDEKESPVRVIRFREVCRQTSHIPLGKFE
jgi:hypothetical protein